ncbi:unnamed protein product [Linum trigynum]|uniref:Uncharacterized protein n=1 Tax=Linum trigynum TaxID=586398 RepID=A0AAV2DU93_9ROSI
MCSSINGQRWTLQLLDNVGIWNPAGKEGLPPGIWNPPEKKARRRHRERLVAARCKWTLQLQRQDMESRRKRRPAVGNMEPSRKEGPPQSPGEAGRYSL